MLKDLFVKHKEGQFFVRPGLKFPSKGYPRAYFSTIYTLRDQDRDQINITCSRIYL